MCVYFHYFVVWWDKYDKCFNYERRCGWKETCRVGKGHLSRIWWIWMKGRTVLMVVRGHGWCNRMMTRVTLEKAVAASYGVRVIWVIHGKCLLIWGRVQYHIILLLTVDDSHLPPLISYLAKLHFGLISFVQSSIWSCIFSYCISSHISFGQMQNYSRMFFFRTFSLISL